MNELTKEQHTDLTWFTNNVLATSTGRREGEFYSDVIYYMRIHGYALYI